MTLQIVPTRWYSSDVTVVDGSQPVADIDVSWWREKGVLTVQGTTYKVYREGLVTGAFIGTVSSRAERERSCPTRGPFRCECSSSG